MPLPVIRNVIIFDDVLQPTQMLRTAMNAVEHEPKPLAMSTHNSIVSTMRRILADSCELSRTATCVIDYYQYIDIIVVDLLIEHVPKLRESPAARPLINDANP